MLPVTLLLGLLTFLGVKNPQAAETIANNAAELALDYGATPAKKAARRFQMMVVAIILYYAVVLGMFGFLTFLGLTFYAAIALAVFAILPMFVFSWISFYAQNALEAGAEILENAGQGINNSIPKSVYPQQEWRKLRRTTRLILGGPLTIINVFYVATIALPGTMLGGILLGAGGALSTMTKAVRWLARVGMYLALWFGALAAVMLLDAANGSGLMDGFTLILITVFAAVWIAIGVLGDWTIGRVGIPGTAFIPALVIVGVLLIAIFAHVDPRIAEASGAILQNGHDVVAKQFESVNVYGASPKNNGFKVTKEIKRTFWRNEDGSFSVKESGNPAIAVGKTGIDLGKTERSNGVVLSLVAFRDEINDPEMVAWNSPEGKQKWRWVPRDAITPYTPDKLGVLLQTKEIRLNAKSKWFDTGIDLTGKRVVIKYKSGTWSNGGDNPQYCDAKGFPGTYKEILVPGERLASLVAKTSGSTNGEVYVGESYQGSLGSGNLLLTMNDKEDKFEDNDGSIVVEISVYE